MNTTQILANGPKDGLSNNRQNECYLSFEKVRAKDSHFITGNLKQFFA